MGEAILMNPIRSLKRWRAEVGVLAPMSWMNREWEEVVPGGIRFSTAVMGSESHTEEVLKGHLNAVEVEAKKLNQGRKCDLICFACTSGSFIEGRGYDQTIIERIEKVSGSPATTASTCVLEVFRDMGVKKIAMMGPYPDSTFEAEVKFFKENGVETLYWKGLGFVEMADYWEYAMDPYSACKLVKESVKAAPSVDCVFATCMATPILGVSDYLEKEIRKPVISSQSGVILLTQVMAVEWAKYNIRVNAVCPGPIKTPMTDIIFNTEKLRKTSFKSVPLNRFGRAEEVAKVVVFLASDEASYVTGQSIAIDGGSLNSTFYLTGLLIEQ